MEDVKVTPAQVKEAVIAEIKVEIGILAAKYDALYDLVKIAYEVAENEEVGAILKGIRADKEQAEGLGLVDFNNEAEATFAAGEYARLNCAITEWCSQVSTELGKIKDDIDPSRKVSDELRESYKAAMNKTLKMFFE